MHNGDCSGKKKAKEVGKRAEKSQGATRSGDFETCEMRSRERV